jgi:inosine-uridine nucleoside N-ribohydrolase
VLAHPAAFDLVAVTTVCGDTRLRARIAARLLGLAGRTHVDVCAGERAPLLRPESRFVWFGHESDPLPEGPDARLPDESAPERIVRAAHEHPGLELVAVGPLTNVARAVALDPKLPQRVAGLTVMGGHVRSVRLGTKELPHGIDYNLCSDPEATVAVLGAGFRTTLVTADVTLQTWMGPADLARIEAGGPVARAIGAMLRTWTGVQKKLFSSWGGPEPSEFVAFLHDPLTVQALVDASPLRFETLRIVPTIERGVLRTIEVPAGAGLGAGLGAEMQVATGVDALAARDVIVGGLASL